MHFWIGRRGSWRKPMVTPVHRFQAVEVRVPHRRDAAHVFLEPQGPSLHPHHSGRLKCGMWASFALVTVFMAGAKFYFNTQSTGLEVLVFCALLVIVLFAGCAVSLCEAVTHPPQPQVVTTAPATLMLNSTSSAGSSGSTAPVHVGPPQVVRESTHNVITSQTTLGGVAPPPPYHIAVLLPPPPPPGPPSPPPAYDKAVKHT